MELNEIKKRLYKEKPIAAFMLCVCCIDTLSGLCYGGKSNSGRWERFISNYMKTYQRLELYNRCRNNIIHAYTSNNRYALTSDPAFLDPFKKIILDDIYIYK